MPRSDAIIVKIKSKSFPCSTLCLVVERRWAIKWNVCWLRVGNSNVCLIQSHRRKSPFQVSCNCKTNRRTLHTFRRLNMQHEIQSKWKTNSKRDGNSNKIQLDAAARLTLEVHFNFLRDASQIAWMKMLKLSKQLRKLFSLRFLLFRAHLVRANGFKGDFN